MATQKRRVVYLSDWEWALLRATAKEHDTTISGVIRGMWKIAHEAAPAGRAETTRVLTAAAGNTRPFTPVPKPSQRKHQ